MTLEIIEKLDNSGCKEPDTPQVAHVWEYEICNIQTNT